MKLPAPDVLLVQNTVKEMIAVPTTITSITATEMAMKALEWTLVTFSWTTSTQVVVASFLIVEYGWEINNELYAYNYLYLSSTSSHLYLLFGFWSTWQYLSLDWAWNG